MEEKITNLIFEFEETLFNQEGKVRTGGSDLLIWLRFHRYGVGMVSALPEEKVISILEGTEVGEYFDQGICQEQREELKQDPYLVAREELCEVDYVNQGATEQEAHALSEPIEAYAVVATEEGLRRAHDAGCHTILLMDTEREQKIAPEQQVLAEVILPDLAQLQKWLEEQENKLPIEMEVLQQKLSVCKLASVRGIDLDKDFYFIGKTDEEISLVCKTEDLPKDDLAGELLSHEDGWRGFRIKGVPDFSLVGILSEVTGLLAKYQIGIFAVSTFNTDYILVKEEQFKKASQVLAEAGYLK